MLLTDATGRPPTSTADEGELYDSFASMKHLTFLATALVSLALSCVPAATAAAQDHEPYGSYVLGPRYSVLWTDALPEVRWDDAPAGERFVVTAPGLGYVLDDAGAPKLLLDWRDGRERVEDRAYVGESFFGWGLQAVRGGESFDPEELRSRSKDRRHDGGDAIAWTGTRTVQLSNPGHGMVFVITPTGATATDNGLPLGLTGEDGNYRAYGPDFEVGVSVRPDGYVYHYYAPR